LTPDDRPTGRRPPRATPDTARRVASTAPERYAGVALVKKLGIRAGSVVVLAHPPEGFEDLLDPLPEGVVVKRSNRGPRDLTIWFVTTPGELHAGIAGLAARCAKGALWIGWPKPGRGRGSELSHAVVQRAGLDSGLVDSKICSIDDTWSALRFTPRHRPSTP
jgi:hypothetical protein